MGENTKIEWAHHTFNPWEGCTKVGPGCDHCYAENRNARFAGGEAINWGPGAPRRRTSASNWNNPIRWNAEAARLGVRYRVFCASLADWLDNEVPVEWLADLLDLIRRTPNLDWLLLSKRIGNFYGRIEEAHDLAHDDPIGTELYDWLDNWLNVKAPENVWLGATVVNQHEADRDIPKLLETPAAVRWLSMEPLLGATDISRFLERGDAGMRDVDPLAAALLAGAEESGHAWIRPAIDWVVVGGESGPGARPMHPDWARYLRDQCVAAGVPFLFKQWGDWAPAEFPAWPENADYMTEAGTGHYFNDRQWMERIGKKKAGRLLDGLTWDQYPERTDNHG